MTIEINHITGLNLETNVGDCIVFGYNFTYLIHLVLWLGMTPRLRLYHHIHKYISGSGNAGYVLQERDKLEACILLRSPSYQNPCEAQCHTTPMAVLMSDVTWTYDHMHVDQAPQCELLHVIMIPRPYTHPHT